MAKIARRNAGALVALAACTLLTACNIDDDHAGLPETDSPRGKSTTSVVPQPSSTTNVPVVTTTTTTPPPVTVAVGEVAGNAKAAAALEPWVRDLVSLDLDQLVRKCWTVDPDVAREMYADKDGILAAVAEPGIDGQFAVSWKGATETVSVKRTEIASGYACPRVTTPGVTNGYTVADARYAVFRYLSRWVGKPVDPNDVEGRYPLVCAGSVLSNNPGKLTGSTAFTNSEMTSEKTGRDSVEITVPVTNSSGVTQSTSFTLAIGSEGYCINNIGN
ncbi:hypothetical protein [Nocardia jejuensis]|uniref:hypothetical protein n=1 Tax=Nocardia jejuensis TaxID=328049 RepID=UPI000836F24B|nr:hypothetical protein [Nocardia jejuensis]